MYININIKYLTLFISIYKIFIIFCHCPTFL